MPFSGKILLLSLIFYVISIGIAYSPLPRDECGNVCGIIGKNDPLYYLLYGWALASILAIIELILNFIKKTSKKKSFIVLVISLSLILLYCIWYAFLCTTCMRSHPPSCEIYGTTEFLDAKSAARQFIFVQELFYDEYLRYADTQDELVNTGFLSKKIINPLTDKEFTDKDGSGIEGGDNEPKTWSIAVYIPKKEFKWCKLVSGGFWYTCDQYGCK